MPISEGTQLQQAADTVQTQASTQQTKAATQLTSLQAQSLELQNQQAQMSLQGAQQYAKALAQVSQRIRSGQAAPATPAAADTTSSADAAAPAAGSAAPAPNSPPTSIALPTAPVASPAPTADPSNSAPTGTQNLLPPGVDPSWKVNKTTDWYTDADGNPISHYTGPTVSPSGRINMHSASIQDEIADTMSRNGANPAFIAQMRLQGEQKAMDVDKANVSLYQDLAKGQEAEAAAAASKSKVQKDIQEHVANLADFDLSQPNPQAAFLQTVGQNPTMWAGIMKTAVKPGDPPITDANDPRILPILKGLQAQSPLYMERQKVAEAGVHVGPPTIDPNTGAQIPGRPFRVGSDGTIQWLTGPTAPQGGGAPRTTPTAPSTGGGSTPAAPAATVGPAEADTKSGLPLYARRQMDALGTFQISPSDLPESPRSGGIPRSTILANMSKYYPGYDAGTAPTAIAAEKDYGAGGASGKTLSNAETAYSHANIVAQLAAAAKPDGSLPDVPFVNSLKNTLSKASGGAPIHNLDDIMELYATEQAKFIEGGAPSVSGIQAQRDKLNAAMSNGSIAGVLATNQAAAVEKAKSMKDSYLGSFPADSATQARVSANFDRKIPNLAPVIAGQGSAAQTATTISNAKLPNASSAATPLAGKTVTPSQLQQYMDKNKVDMGTAMTRLKALGATLRGLTIFEGLISTLFEVCSPFRFPRAVGANGKRNRERGDSG